VLRNEDIVTVTSCYSRAERIHYSVWKYREAVAIPTKHMPVFYESELAVCRRLVQAVTMGTWVVFRACDPLTIQKTICTANTSFESLLPSSCSVLLRRLSRQRTTIVNNRFRASHSIYNSWPNRRRDDGRARFITAVVWRHVVEDAILIFARILYLKREYFPSGASGRIWMRHTSMSNSYSVP